MPRCFSFGPCQCAFTYEWSCSTRVIKEQFYPSTDRFLNLGALKEAFKTMPGSLTVPLSDCSGRNSHGQPKAFSAQFCWRSGFAPLRAFSHKLLLDRLNFSSSLLWKVPPMRSSSSDRREVLAQHRWQALGTSQTQERSGKLHACLRLATRKHPPNAGPDEHLRAFTCRGVGLCLSTGRRARLVFKTQVQKNRPTFSVPTRCLLSHGCVPLHIVSGYAV